MKNKLRSQIFEKDRRMTGARSLWRANGMKDEHFGKPVFAIVNSFTQFVPGHMHLHETGQMIKKIIESRGYFAAEFNTIAIDDGIAMGHEGMLYSLPSRELIADSVEYMCNAHMADALICITNCDKITPGMLMAAIRLNIPSVFVSGGPMEAGVFKGEKLDLIDAIIKGGDSKTPDSDLEGIERTACPTCGSCSGMFTANSMNCLTEALGFSLPGNGTIVATHINRQKLFQKAAEKIVEITEKYYYKGDSSILPKSIATKEAFSNAMALDIAMGGSTNTILHILALAHEAGVDFNLKDIDNLTHKIPCLCKVAPSSNFHIEDVNHAGGILSIMGELEKGNLINTGVRRIDFDSLKEAIDKFDITRKTASEECYKNCKSAPSGKYGKDAINNRCEYESFDLDREKGCIRDLAHPYEKEGGLAVLYGNIAKKGCVVKTAGVDPSIFIFKGSAKVFHSQEQAVEGILNGSVKEGDVVVIKYEGPKGGPGMQEMLYPTSFIKSAGLGKKCALITDGRFSGGTSGLSIGHISPEAADGGEIALIMDGDIIEINIPARSINVLLDDNILKDRKNIEIQKGKNAFKPERNREIPKSLKFYSLHVTSADLGAVRILPEDL